MTDPQNAGGGLARMHTLEDDDSSICLAMLEDKICGSGVPALMKIVPLCCIQNPVSGFLIGY